MEDSSLAQLQLTESCDLVLRGRIARKWLELDENTGAVLGVNLIMIDSDDKRLHCWISKELFSMFDKLIVPRCIYDIQHYQVSPYTATNRCFRAENHLLFLPNTTAVCVDDPCCNISLDVYNFFDLKNIASADTRNSYLTDVVGIIDHVGEICRVTSSPKGNKIFLDFCITDLITDVKVRFWDNFALSFKKAYAESSEHPTIVIISSSQLKRNEYNGSSHVRSVSATHFCFNANVSRVHHLRKRFFDVNGL
ncbi:hypothetical protein ACET3Z_023368 [Daucus carota]